MLKQNENTVKIIFKNLPLKMHDMAQPAALAALAANKQGKFWEYHDELFAEKKITDETFIKIAEKLSLDTAQFKQDMASKEIINHLRHDMAEAQQLGVTGTPTIFVNGRRIKDRTITGFQTLIDEELQKLQK
ncbi:MAG: protein-disulfide isomerase [Desulforhopalus sp.]